MSHPVTAATPTAVITAIEMVAGGHTQAAVAKVLGCSVRTVGRILADPAVKQALADLRLVLRAKTLQGVQAVTPGLHVWLKEMVEAKTSAKDADALSRALLNLEKTAASASGENRPQAQLAQQVQVVIQPNLVKIAPGWVKSKQAPAAPSPAAIPALPTAEELAAIEASAPAVPPKPKPLPRDL
jgi:hypothetical protein